MTIRSALTPTRLMCGLVTAGLMAGSSTADEVPKELDAQRLAHITVVFASPNSEFEWAALGRDGEKVLPYVAFIIADSDSTGREVERALIFARDNLTKYDCTRLVEPTVSRLMHDDWELRAEAMCLLGFIGSKTDCPAAAMLLYSDSYFNRLGAGCMLGKFGGRGELFALDHWLRVRAADAKGDKQEKEAFESITKSRDRIRERLDAADKKVKPGEPTEADKAVAKFADADAKVRAGAVGELKKVGSKADSSAVVALLHDPDAKVREAAAEWLGAVGGKRELVALEIRIREHRAADDAAFDAFAKAKKAVAARVDGEEKKVKDADPKAKPPEKDKK